MPLPIPQNVDEWYVWLKDYKAKHGQDIRSIWMTEDEARVLFEVIFHYPYDERPFFFDGLKVVVKSDTPVASHEEQQLPTVNTHPFIQDLVLADILRRKQVGIERYGTALQPHNGRDMLRDLYEELVDACVYIRGVMFERDGQ